jgi:tetratricopeptide (TPR) repeat protein
MTSDFSRSALIVAAVFWAVFHASHKPQVAWASEEPAIANFAEPQTAFDTLDSALEEGLFRDAEDGVWNEHSLFTAALIASGVRDEAALREAIGQYGKLAIDMRSTMRPEASIDDRASDVLSFLHRRILYSGYDLQATELQHVFATGRFNCVSATVLFNSLAAEAGLPVRVLKLPQHTSSALVDGDRQITIEPTCADWFEIRARRQDRMLGDDAGPRAGPVALDVAEEPRQIVSDIALVAMVYYNRGVEAMKKRNFEEAIRLNSLALRLDPANEAALGNLLAATNKLALRLCDMQEFAKALAVLQIGLQLAPNHRALHDNRVFVYHRWLEMLATVHDDQPATAILAQAADDEPSPVWTQWRTRLLQAGR